MNIIEIARYLRRNQTEAETLLWEKLRDKQTGFKIRRQHPIDNLFIIDFYCAFKKLCIEVDGSIHLIPEVKVRDATRQKHLEKMGYTFIRIKNEEVFEDIEGVVDRIKDRLMGHSSGISF